MPTFDIEAEEITAFEVGDKYIFKTYFDEDQLFKQLEKYYKEYEYRFEIPEGSLKQVRQKLEKYYYELTVTDNIEEYCIVIDKERNSSNILRNTVMKKHRGQHEILVMKNELSKKQAIEEGAVSLQKSDVEKERLTWESR